MPKFKVKCEWVMYSEVLIEAENEEAATDYVAGHPQLPNAEDYELISEPDCTEFEVLEAVPVLQVGGEIMELETEKHAPFDQIERERLLNRVFTELNEKIEDLEEGYDLELDYTSPEESQADYKGYIAALKSVYELIEEIRKEIK